MKKNFNIITNVKHFIDGGKSMRRTIILIAFLLIFSLLGTAAAENTTDHEKINILILNPPHYARHSVEATYKIYEEYPQYKDKFNITVRTGEQISKMSSDDLTAMIKSSDIIIVNQLVILWKPIQNLLIH